MFDGLLGRNRCTKLVAAILIVCACTQSALAQAQASAPESRCLETLSVEHEKLIGAVLGTHPSGAGGDNVYYACSPTWTEDTRRRCAQGDALACAVLSTEPDDTAEALRQRACALGHLLACAHRQRERPEPALENACRESPRTCELLGDYWVLGSGSRFTPAIETAYRAACDAGGARACAKLVAAVIHEHARRTSLDLSSLERARAQACAASFRFACAVPPSRLLAESLERSCFVDDTSHPRDATACIRMAQALSEAGGDPTHALGIVCVASAFPEPNAPMSGGEGFCAESREDPLFAVSRWCRVPEHACDFSAFATRRFATLGSQCRAGQKESCERAALMHFYGVGTVADPVAAEGVLSQLCVNERLCDGAASIYQGAFDGTVPSGTPSEWRAVSTFARAVAQRFQSMNPGNVLIDVVMTTHLEPSEEFAYLVIRRRGPGPILWARRVRAIRSAWQSRCGDARLGVVEGELDPRTRAVRIVLRYGTPPDWCEDRTETYTTVLPPL